jgi:hypothetical protein
MRGFMRTLIYDIEILRAIPSGARLEGIEYCAGWHDHANMGISVIGTCIIQNVPPYEYYFSHRADRHDLSRFQRDIDFCDFVVGFNSESFDDKVCAANGIRVRTNYDILRETYKAKDWDPYPETFDDKYKGYGLDALAFATLGERKTGSGASAPIWWQLGEKEKVIEYCENDVRITKDLFQKIIAGEPLIDPHTGEPIYLRNPLKT